MFYVTIIFIFLTLNTKKINKYLTYFVRVIKIAPPYIPFVYVFKEV